jgi:hypothetical protein
MASASRRLALHRTVWAILGMVGSLFFLLFAGFSWLLPWPDIGIWAIILGFVVLFVGAIAFSKSGIVRFPQEGVAPPTFHLFGRRVNQEKAFVLFVCIVYLLVITPLAIERYHYWMLDFAHIEAQGTIIQEKDCRGSSVRAIIRFTDKEGKIVVSQPTLCEYNYHVGDTVTVWYRPDFSEYVGIGGVKDGAEGIAFALFLGSELAAVVFAIITIRSENGLTELIVKRQSKKKRRKARKIV